MRLATTFTVESELKRVERPRFSIWRFFFFFLCFIIERISLVFALAIHCDTLKVLDQKLWRLSDSFTEKWLNSDFSF